jgi:adenylylsulfate kinase-like enzyme
MPNAEVLVLHGAPGSGKSTLARALFEQLRVAEQPVAVIDPDELNLVHPDQGRAFWQRNLQVIWPNYTAMGDLRAIIPTVIADAEDHRHLHVALPARRFITCELIAPMAILKQRVRAREPNEHWKRELEKWVDVYHQRDESQKFGDFQVTTHDKSVDDTAAEILEQAGWKARERTGPFK